MKKIISIVVIGMVTGLVFAQDSGALKEQPSDFSISAGSDFYSAYVWRGQIINNRMVAQPSATASKGPFSLNVWGNWNMVETHNDDTEIDFTGAYTLPLNLEDVTVDVGVIAYTFPGHGNEAKATEEIFAKSTFNNILLTPVTAVYYDVDENNGWYGSQSFSQGVEVSDALKAEIGTSVGYGTRNYNKYYFTKTSSAFNDFNTYISATYALTEKASLGARLQYTYLNNDLAKTSGQDDDILWGGISLSYKFL